MNVQKRNDVSIYCLSLGTTLPEWIGERARRNLAKRDESVRRRIELLQDFQMPASSNKIVQSADGRYIMATGIYPPRVRCYDVHDLGMKFERYINAEAVDIVMLGEDYGKMALLLDNRQIDFHAPYGTHETIRIPTFGRGMAYEPTTCELIVAARGNRVYRINLEEGRFSEPWTLESTTGDCSANCVAVHQMHPLATLGCDDGIVRFWDSRSPDFLKPFLKLDVQSAVAGHGYADVDSLSFGRSLGEITAVAHDPTGLYMAAATVGGLVALYDIRSSRPLFVQEHKHGLPIHTVRFHSGSGMVLSSDEKLIKIWRYKSSSAIEFSSSKEETEDYFGADMCSRANGGSSQLGAVKVNVEGSGKLTNFIVAGDESDPTGNISGLLLCTTDQPKMDSFYIPALGVAPKWCSFLENITEELEERDLTRGHGVKGAGDLADSEETVFENYKFVSREELEKLGISNLIGTPLLRGYMHGFFMDVNLYNRVKAVANPFEYEEYQKKKLKERLEAKRASRIEPRASDQKQKPSVNPELAERLKIKASAATKSAKVAKEVLVDNRFGSLFTNPDFQIDEKDENFLLRNPSGVISTKRKKENMDSDDEDDDEIDDARKAALSYEVPDDKSLQGTESYPSGSDASDSDDDGFDGAKVRGEAYQAMRALERSNRKRQKGRKRSSTRLKSEVQEAFELGESGGIELALGNEDTKARARQRLEEMNMPLGKRFAKYKDDEEKLEVRARGGGKEVTYIPQDVTKKVGKSAKKEGSGESTTRNRRDVRELGFRTTSKGKK